MNENSLAVYPHYVSITDLHTTAPWLERKRNFSPGITDDIDGDPREPSYLISVQMNLPLIPDS